MGCICEYFLFVYMCCQGAAANPENEDQQQRLREAAEGLRVATNAAAQNAIKKKLVNRLEVSNWGRVKQQKVTETNDYFMPVRAQIVNYLEFCDREYVSLVTERV